jgi:hypothetical protein
MKEEKKTGNKRLRVSIGREACEEWKSKVEEWMV